MCRSNAKHVYASRTEGPTASGLKDSSRRVHIYISSLSTTGNTNVTTLIVDTFLNVNIILIATKGLMTYGHVIVFVCM